KTVLERKAPPTFGVLIEIQDKDRLAIHHNVAEMKPTMGQQTMDDLRLLLGVMPPSLKQTIEARPDAGGLIEIVLDLGRLPEARFPDRGEDLATEPVNREDIGHVVERIGRFGRDNRAGIERTLHRISAIRNRQGEVVGLTCRVGRAVHGTVEILRDVIESGASILLLGRPGVGKTTLLREAARVLADELGKRVIVVDTSNEIAGDGDIPHPGIGRARRMQVPSPEEQHAVMIEAVENHMPQVIVIDEIGTAAEAMAARTIAERGVQLIATAHGNTLENLLQNPTLSDLVGGIQAVTLSDEEARRRGTQKTVLERKAPPTFGVLIEIQDKDRLAIHHNVAEVVDRFLREIPPRPELRTRNADGGVDIQRSPVSRPSYPGTAPEGNGTSQRGGAPGNGHGYGGRRRGGGFNGYGPGAAAERRVSVEASEGAPTGEPAEPAESPFLGGRNRRKTVRLFPYAVSKSKLDRAIRKFRVPAVVVDDLDAADVVLTLKAQERRAPRRLRDAEARGVPVFIIKSNTIAQMENFLADAFDAHDPAAGDEAALQEVEDAIDEALDQGRPVELSPQNNHIRRLQHQVVERYGLTSESKGEEPYRRVIIFPSPV
ncbi:MAG TPA: R3H domain-containing nucleic acid-binding protein, partial [Thermoanaerobaculia bacterium]|nr:R3H domain-containing nucleic acid-binding protein [Thermoanaerobaculia bacterium]